MEGERIAAPAKRDFGKGLPGDIKKVLATLQGRLRSLDEKEDREDRRRRAMLMEAGTVKDSLRGLENWNMELKIRQQKLGGGRGGAMKPRIDRVGTDGV